ncbi:MAG TPA: RsmE family RNA methyltransferase [Spirochaetota bacterium]|nr:RsmE family RNA methyltransferase [Spirochaetota bacterium]HPM35254.1 RsmE family RNA methyltransferase [Spirochaetota bacterium]
MPQYFINAKISVGDFFNPADEDYHHLIKVRRVRAGDDIDVRDSEGFLHRAEIIDIEKNRIIAKSLSSIPPKNEKIMRIYISLIKFNAFEESIQHAVEAGVSEIIPVKTERSVVDVSSKKDNKLERWRKIAAESAKQSYAPRIPSVAEISSFSDSLKSAHGLILIAHPFSERKVSDIDFSSTEYISLFIGPEGGFSASEIALAESSGAHSFSCGSRVFRAETAAAVIPSVVLSYN